MSTQNIDLDLKRWSWRGSDPNLTDAISGMVSRMKFDRGLRIDGYSATRIVVENFLDDPNVTNEQITQISRRARNDFGVRDLDNVRNKYPDYASRLGHIVAVDAMYILTGQNQAWISDHLSGLGFTGTPGKLITYATDPKLLLGTILHDITDYLQDAKIEGINKAIWGVSGKVTSALVMALEAFAYSVTDIIPRQDEILNIIGADHLPIEEIALLKTVSNLGNVSSMLGAKIAIYFADESFANQLIAQTAGKTVGGWLGDAIAYELDGIIGNSLPARALYTRLYRTFTTTAVNMVSSAISQALNEAFDIEDPVAQIGVDAVTSALTRHVFSSLAIEIFEKDFAVQYLEVNPNIDLSLTLDSIAGEVLNTGFGALKGFVSSQLFKLLDEVWEGVNLNNEGAAIGGILGGFIAPGIGNFLGQVIGGWVWDIVADKDPRAYYTVSLDSATNSFINRFSFEKDDGRIEVAGQMSRSAKDTLQLIAGMIGGKPSQIKTYEYGHYEEDFIYKPVDSGRMSFSNVEEALQAGLISQLKTVRFEGGDPYMKWVAALSSYNPSLQQLFSDLGVAKEYSVHKTDPILYGQMILNLEDESVRRYLLDDWRRIHHRASELALNTVPGNDGSEFIAGTEVNDVMDGGIGNDFLFGDAGNDTLKGGQGDDRIEGGLGNDTLEGGDGNDTLIPDVIGQGVYENLVDGGTGVDVLIVDYSTYGSSGGAVGGTGVSNLISGKIHNAVVTGWTVLSHSNIERFNITGSSFDDKLKARAEDTLDGGAGKDILTLDLATATRTVAVDFTQVEEQVSYGSTRVRNFETINTIVTGTGNDTIKLSTTASVSKGIVDGGTGTDTLIVDYSTYGISGGAVRGTGVSNLISGKIHNAVVTGWTVLSHSNIERFNITGTVNNDALYGASLSDTLNGGMGNDILTGRAGSDTLIGGDGSDWLAGDAGNDILTGGVGSDRFIYSTNAAYVSSAFGQDTITDFTTGTDKIVLDLTTFTAIRSAVGNGFSRASEFAVVSNDNAVSTNSALIVYSSGSGRLFYNQNGLTTGLGTGSNFAALRSNPDLKASDFIIQS